MDATELLAPGPGLSTTTIVLIAVAVFGGVLALAGKIADFMGPDWTDSLAGPAMFVGVGICAIGSLASAGSAYEDKPDRGALMESTLFEGYGFTVEHPGILWDDVSDAGNAGVVTKLTREGVEQDVRVLLDGTRLVVTGPDGLEIPVNDQADAGSTL